ncbi:YesN/AraC family two-component response regulator [Flavobacterium arsenatis]|uniref:YesN/AraC family two-component response regulator n=1 Tax=Flavobacterium arsenatis TaxID=1484332 RepID=A0ABU1TMT3_9FLAO|nr:helix-turn-helix domain-containing protein [Flavobacterium arsenatis]MDR6967266.1 YesN/AraC family two-component response regulator [Flavobacterium arsenatis]
MKIRSCIFDFRFVLAALLFCICGTVSIAQSFPQNEELLEKANQLVYSNPDEALKIAEHLLKISAIGTEKASLHLLVAESYVVKGNYNNAITSVFEAGKHFETIDHTLQIKILLLKSALLRDLYLDSQSEKYGLDAEKLTQKLSSKNNKAFKANFILNKVEMHLERRRSHKAQDLLQKNEMLFKDFSFENPEINQNHIIVKARIFSSLSELDSATIYFNRAIQFSQNRKYPNVFEKAIVYNELGRLYFQKKEHQESIVLLLKALEEAKKISNTPLLKSINRQLAVNYLALNNKVNYQLYSNEFLRLNNTLEQAEQESVNNAFNLISQEQELYFEDEKKEHSVYFYVVLASSIIIILICLLLWIKVRWKKKRLKEIINYLEISRNIFAKTTPEIKEPNKKISIPLETEQAILAKLKRFEASTKFTSNEMSLAVLAGQFDTNTKYLSEIINKHYQDNFNTYINKLRINFIIQKLKTDPNYMHYKISYLAEKSGFSSHSSFATVFKSITGIAPVTFIELLKEETAQNDKETV